MKDNVVQNENKSSNVKWHQPTVTREKREARNGHKSFILWFTGLSGAGKSTLAHAVEEELYKMGCNTFVFDGDNVRHGLSKDLGFSQEDRKENIRRIGEMCKLFIEAGVIALTAFISPYIKDRNTVRQMVKDRDFIEIYCDCSLDICEKRDVKGSYAKARKGEIPNFTGISAPYEVPENPEIIVSTGRDTLEQCLDKVIKYLIDNNLIVK
jgi:adenylylsulfate kinase